MAKPSCTFFLSHQYRATEVNLFFYGLFASIANVQFEVDIGTFSTNVTRLERKLRDADAFVGIYPCSLPADASLADLRHESRYFRLELDLAMRAQKPALVLYDRRYKSLLLPSSSIHSLAFDTQEIVGSTRRPSAGRAKSLIERFIEIVASWKMYQDLRLEDRSPTVGLLLPDDFPDSIQQTIADTLSARGFVAVSIPRPHVLTIDVLRGLQHIDFLVAEIGDDASQMALVGYAHGQFIPTIRLRRQQAASGAEESLLSGVEVGYAKDVIRWGDAEELAAGLRTRLASLEAPAERIHSRPDADSYFRRASLRKEAVFVSYTGTDRDIAADLVASLKKRFATVFDYKDGGESIPPGSSWLPQIFESLAQSAVGMPLVSTAYLASGNCLQEAETLVARKNAGDLKLLVPVILSAKDKPELPTWMRDRQYLRLWEYASIDAVAEAVVAQLPKA
jgi:hypothetical protein